MTNTTLEMFMESNRISVDEEGIKIPHAVYRNGEKRTLCALAMPPLEIHIFIARILVRERPDELVFGMDRFMLQGQGVETKDALSVSHWNGTAWKFGLIPYRFDPPLFGPLVWDNPIWNQMLTRELTSAWDRITNAPHRQPHPAMTFFKRGS